MGSLERAKIYVLDNTDTKSYTRKTVGDASSVLDVCFNPKEYSLDKSIEWDSEKSFTDAPPPEFKKPSPMTLSVTLQFDSYEERVSVRDKWVRKLESMTMMKAPLTDKSSATDKKNNRPPTILFVWGEFVFQGVIESLGQKYTMFLSDGTPVRAECALKIRNVITAAIDDASNQASFSKSGSADKIHSVGPNDRMDLIAMQYYGDPGRWTDIAAHNDIVDPGSFTDSSGKKVGQLKIPGG